MPDSEHIDPLGRRIRLSDATWYGHILRNHPELADARTAVYRAIESPDEIHFSSSASECRLYYGRTLHNGLMICVVAEVAAGFVKTAYFAKRIKPGGIEWPSPKR